MRLRRGYENPPEGVTVQEADPKAEEADEAAAAQPVDKLLLVVHGIGQNLGGANITCRASREKAYPPLRLSISTCAIWLLLAFAYALFQERRSSKT